jgi:hypothetical protein
MTDPTWTIHGADYDVEVDGLLSEFINRRRGESVSLRFEIRRRGGNTAETGGQYSAAAGFQYSSASGAQYSGGAPSIYPAQERYERLVNYHDFAGATDVAVDDKRVPYYRESVPQRADVSSLLIGVEPNGDVAPATGVWAIVTGGGEVSRLFGDMAVVELECVVLAEYSELSRSEVKSQFEEPL